jgi:hypothetical protein
MKFVLRQDQRQLELPAGRFVMGRGEGCQLVLDDPLVSRQHAALEVTETGATLHDLGSRNGVRLNGQRIGAPHVVVPGDKIGVGKATLLFGESQQDVVRTLVQAPTLRVSTFGMLGDLADKALGLGRGDEAERLVGPQIEHLLRHVEQGRRYEVLTVERASELALRIAQLTGSAAGMATVCRFYSAMRRLPPVQLVDELIAVARKLKQPSREELRGYLAVLRDKSDEFGPADRFLFGRLEGLERSLG